MNELINKTRQWFHDKGIIEKSNPLKQLLKTQEELTETRDAAIKLQLCNSTIFQTFGEHGETANKLREELKDGIGDTMVTLIGVCEMWGKDITELSGHAVVRGYAETLEEDPFKLLNELQNNLLKLYSFVATIEKYSAGYVLGMMVVELHVLAKQYGFTLDECLQQAYDVISKRSGVIVDGIFIKNKDGRS